MTGAAEAGIPKPPWVKVRLPSGRRFALIKALKRKKSLHTVCEEAMCPNIGECWESGHAAFLILGDSCTRNCRFCAVRGGEGGRVDPGEPTRVAEATAAMGLGHAVVTSVTRDDLPDGGAGIFAETIRRIHGLISGCTVEVLIPDFKGDPGPLKTVVGAGPDILGHNIETVSRLYPQVRPQANYRRSLDLLGEVKSLNSDLLTKSGFMVGLGETKDEVLEVMGHLREVGCDILTIGQYLRPSKNHLAVARYWSPEEFEALKSAGYGAGFRWVESGPLVRSSFGAQSQARSLLRRKSRTTPERVLA